MFIRYIEKIFTQLEEFRAFELLRSGLDRSKYLLVKEAKVIAMTCTHAALKRRELVDLGMCAKLRHSTMFCSVFCKY
jgi:intron-binding protein aquarius